MVLVLSVETCEDKSRQIMFFWFCRMSIRRLRGCRANSQWSSSKSGFNIGTRRFATAKIFVCLVNRPSATAIPWPAVYIARWLVGESTSEIAGKRDVFYFRIPPLSHLNLIAERVPPLHKHDVLVPASTTLSAASMAFLMTFLPVQLRLHQQICRRKITLSTYSAVAASSAA